MIPRRGSQLRWLAARSVISRWRREDWGRTPRLNSSDLIIAATGLITGAVLFWLALRSSGCDWFISETHADVIFTGLRRFGEFPFFSFAFNGGSYFVQDPQSNLFSPVVPLTLLVGPSVALRLLEGIWGALGVWLFTVWMRRYVRFEAALLGAVANATSLGVLWRVAAGNDMFLWHLGLPGLLYAIDRLLNDRNVASMLTLGLCSGALLLGPTFGSFVYLFLPVAGMHLAQQLLFPRLRRDSRRLMTQLGLLLGACALAALIASPKLACWSAFAMTRPVGDYGPIPLGEAVRNLFDFTLWNEHTVFASILSHGRARGWGIEESSVALQPAATLLTLVGGVAGWWTNSQRRLVLLALNLVAVGLLLSCSSVTFEIFRTLSGGGFRVVQRFLAISAFGLAVIAAQGADFILSRLASLRAPFTAATALAMLGSAVWWTHSASQFAGASECDAVQRSTLNPIARSNQERKLADRVDSFRELRTMPGLGRDFLKGGGYSDGFLIVGNDFGPAFGSRRNQFR